MIVFQHRPLRRNAKAPFRAHSPRPWPVRPAFVVDKAGIMTGLLVFYVAYTMWWGFAIFFMFDGIGLTMKKAKVKKEV